MHPDYRLSDDPVRLQIDAIHAYRAADGAQIGFARVITDHATFAHLADVYVLEEHQGRGIASAMLGYFDGHPRLQGLRRWTLNTRDAHSLYERHGWERITGPFMQRHDPDAYREAAHG